MENTVQNHPEFRTAKSTEYMITVLGVRPMKFQQYYDLLQSAAQQYDETMSKTKKSHRYVYMPEQTYENEQPLFNNINTYGITTS